MRYERLRQRRVVGYSPKVRVTIFVSCVTLTTQKLTSTHPTLIFYEGESDGDSEIGEFATNLGAPSSVGLPVEDAISTIEIEISELDTIDFDTMIEVNESQDMSYPIYP